MARLFVIASVFVIGMFMIMLALAFLLQPESTAASLGLVASNTQGLSTLRADFLGFFGIIGICMMWGAWRSNGDVLLVPAIIMLVVIAGRITSAMLDGAFPGYWMPIAIEALIAALLLVARTMVPHRRVKDIAG